MSSNVHVGKKYFKNDEIGTPFCIVIDRTTIENGRLTVRRREDFQQVYFIWMMLFKAWESL